jgi:DNA transformation protein and related proteins
MAGATDARFAAGLIDQLAPLGAVRHRRFFSGQGIVCGEVQFAMILGGIVYLRTDADLAARMQAHGAQPFVYGTRKRDVTVSAYRSVPEECLDDAELLLDWARRSLAVARQNWKPRLQKTKRSGLGKRV